MHACERKRVRRGVKTANKKKEEGEEINEKRRRKKEREKERQCTWHRFVAVARLVVVYECLTMRT